MGVKVRHLLHFPTFYILYSSFISLSFPLIVHRIVILWLLYKLFCVFICDCWCSVLCVFVHYCFFVLVHFSCFLQLLLINCQSFWLEPIIFLYDFEFGTSSNNSKLLRVCLNKTLQKTEQFSLVSTGKTMYFQHEVLFFLNRFWLLRFLEVLLVYLVLLLVSYR